jgi:23S rRNA U2552 (ribose-2'-O)-methylase RlmE/FtsJ
MRVKFLRRAAAAPRAARCVPARLRALRASPPMLRCAACAAAASVARRGARAAAPRAHPSRASSSLRSPSSTEWLSRQLADPYVRAREAAGYRSRSAFKLVEINARCRLLARGASVVDLGAAPGGWSQVAVDIVGGGGAGARAPPTIFVRAGGAAAGAAGAAPAPAARRASFLDISGAEAGGGSGGERAAPPPPPPPPPPGARPLVVAVDLTALEPLRGVQMVCGDFMRAPTRAAVRRALPRGRADVVLSDMAHAFSGDASGDHARQLGLAGASLVFALSVLRAGGHWVGKVRYGREYGALRATVARLFAECDEVKPPASRADSAEAFLVGRRLRAARAPLLPAEAAALAALGVALDDAADD